METAEIALGLSIVAIAFTIFSFWWINARMGRLVVIGPQYVFGRFKSNTLAIQLPIVFQNTGAQTIVISGIRIRFTEANRSDLLWVGFSTDPLHGNFEFKRPVVLKKFDATETIVYFQREKVDNQFQPEKVQLQAIWSGKGSWRTLSTITLPSSSDGWNESFAGIDIVGGVATGERSG